VNNVSFLAMDACYNVHCVVCTFVNFVHGVVSAKGVGTISSEDLSSAICALLILYL